MPESTKHAARCHCGNVRYEVDTDLASVLTCNCSICTKHGFLWSFVPEAQFTLLSGGDNLTEYRKHRGRMEVEAESVAYIVAGLAGFDTSNYSIGYITGWANHDLTLIHQTATRVLHAAHDIASATTP